ncbi:MAG TPA: phytanoyl-CoA dioxygenase family protein [Chitinophagales bacterium]|nr:phytanoyl-CoA dioxygenase family protein [Chitinophagales bacterium]HNL84032.1 phytanoyl-CoA dioxygenase family protein [Chitinophagales bacterium]
MLQLKNSYLQQHLSVNGYFTIPFVNNEIIQQLKEIYQKNFDDTLTPFYSTSFHPDVDLKKRINEEVLNLIQADVEQLFSDFTILGTSFLKKKSNQENPLPLHQDWTVTDEEKYGSFTIWIPLQDTDEQNGAIRIIPGSHLIDTQLRAPSLPVSFEKDRALFDKHLQTLPLKAGEAFVFNQKLMHASFGNSSSTDRLALTIGLIPKNAPLFMLYYDKQARKVKRYSMPDDMFLRYPEIIDKPMLGQLEDEFTYHPASLSEKTFKEKLYQNRLKHSTMESLFKSEEHQQYFEENGYIKIDAIDKNDIQQLIDFLFQSGIKKETGYGFYVGMDHENKQLVKEMMQRIEDIAMPKVAPYLKDYKLITASYVIKDPHPHGIVPPHQDWTFVEDETRHCSVTCWIPLVDTNMENGCMGVIKGSNHFFKSVRPSPSPQVPSPLAKHMFSLFPYFELLPMKAGEALIFDNRTFHASPPNITEQPRLAIGLSFTQKNAELRHYYCKPGTKDTLLKYKIDPEFFTRYDNKSLSELYNKGGLIEGYEMMGEMPFVWEDLTKEEMKKRVLATGNVYNKELTDYMKGLFSKYMKDGIIQKVKGFISRINPMRLVRNNG